MEGRKKNMEERYQDYVIKEGKFIGEFEEMYQKHDNPWHQLDDVCADNSYSRQSTIVSCNKYNAKSIVEFGCGLGHFTNFMEKNICSPMGGSILGVDISKTAIQKAKEKFPKCNFIQGNIKEAQIWKAIEFSKFDVIIFAEIMWYLLEDLPQVIEYMNQYCKNKVFINNLVFYKDDIQKYGKECFTNVKELISYLPFQYLGSITADSLENKESYETQTIFRIN